MINLEVYLSLAKWEKSEIDLDYETKHNYDFSVFERCTGESINHYIIVFPHLSAYYLIIMSKDRTDKMIYESSITEQTLHTLNQLVNFLKNYQYEVTYD